ncbi:pimeloyl-ACP methyl ester carboxylesterase [Kibdelosporangium banguiense]|uniref:Pimeloyl-ACP methyl ester carboxylesterase n=1 Tax=Kibdelosporangium banguiense TaxID=1365924 RepID=A0ABS4TBZ9_9PSEU|nr:alpha/beta hydrolase [Kibdelosporangium banguiense]MBP2321504.1 pimeloyl-ACP methyl ester carboxylesterase [Kibdelosporangium banguiense]
MIVLVGPGLDDGTRCKKLAALLDHDQRVVRVHRRQYQSDIACTVAEEVEDVLALVSEPAVIYGHSSGGVVALEALVAKPELFTGAVIYEPAAVIGPPLAGAELMARVRAAKPSKAMEIFLHEVVGMPAAKARLAGTLVGLVPAYRRLVPRQLNDLEALDQLGNRLDVYKQIEVPTVLVGGDQSPTHLAERLDAIEAVLPNVKRVTLHNLGHDADTGAPEELARIIRAAIRVK